jgi:subtilisin family serine protease
MVTLPPTPDRMRVASELAEVYGLEALYAWVIESIDERCVVFEVPPERTPEEMIRVLSGDRRLLSVQPVHPYRVLSDPAPPATDPYRHLQHGIEEIGLGSARPSVTGRGVSVAVIDTGVAIDHPDLVGRIAKVGNFVDLGERTFATDVHGTAVAGVIAAGADNRIGITGVAPEADVYAYKACWHPNGSAAAGALCNSYTLARAVDAALSDGAQVLNLSIGGPRDDLLARMIETAHSRGVVVVAAFDETRADGGFPAALPGVIAARSTDMEGGLRGTPGSGDRPALAAPGVDVLSTAPGGGYDFFSGSSLAAAHVSGVVALLLEGRPELTPAQVADALAESARPLAAPGSGPESGSYRGGLLIDACAALERAAGRSLCRPAP